MTPPRILFLVVILTLASECAGQIRFRSGIFLHHSTGACIWGPNGGLVSVPGEIANYNASHDLAGKDSVTFSERNWPSDDNEWSTWHRIFDNEYPTDDIRPFLASNPIVMIKSCFPSSAIYSVGTSADTLTPTVKSVANYKWHWRSFVSVMRARPQNFFVIWTNAPLEAAGGTNATQAALSNAFCRWAKDTLAAGRDSSFGAFPKNVFVFDIFHLLAGADGMLPLGYASASGDSHPNAAATALVAPQLVAQFFDAALAYESSAVPAQLELFKGAYDANNKTITLTWRTASEINNLGFEVQRKRENDTAFVALPDGFLPGQGSSFEVHEYSYTDSNVVQGRTLFRLKQIDLDSTFRFMDTIAVDVLSGVESDGSQATGYALEQNYPNPFNPTTVISGQWTVNSDVRLVVYDALGRQVSTLASRWYPAGKYSFTFNANGLASGVYFYRLQAGGFSATKAMMLVR